MILRCYKSITVVLLLLLLCPIVCLASSDPDRCPIDVYYEDTEFLSGESLSDWWGLFEDSKFNGIDVWNDGSFYVCLGDRINVYDHTGKFSHCLHYKSSKGGNVLIRSFGNDGLQLLLERYDCIVDISKNGEIIETKYYSSEDFKNEKKAFLKQDRRIFTSKEYVLEDDLSVRLVLPPRISIPLISNTHITVSNLSGVVYDDSGILFFKEFLLSFTIIISLIFVVCLNIYILKKYHKGCLKKSDN